MTGAIEKQAALADVAGTRYLDPRTLVFTRTAGGFLSLNAGEERWPKVGLFRAFPFDDPMSYIVVKDAEHKEIGIIADLFALDEGMAELCNMELNRRYFIPIIKKITSFKERFGTAHFTVETEYGELKFSVWDMTYNITVLDSGQIFITDVHGNRYMIPHIDKLQAGARHLSAYL